MDENDSFGRPRFIFEEIFIFLKYFFKALNRQLKFEKIIIQKFGGEIQTYRVFFDFENFDFYHAKIIQISNDSWYLSKWRFYHFFTRKKVA